MKLKLNKFITSFLIIAILSWIGYVFIYEKPEELRPSEKIRNIYNSLWLIIVLLVGLWGLRNTVDKKWQKIWVIVYIAVFVSMLLLFIYSKTVGAFTEEFKKLIGNFRLFFCTPFPLMIIFFFQKITDSINTETKKTEVL